MLCHFMLFFMFRISFSMTYFHFFCYHTYVYCIESIFNVLNVSTHVFRNIRIMAGAFAYQTQESKGTNSKNHFNNKT